MKRIFTLLFATSILTAVFAQSPNKMSYQAIVRDANDNLVKEQSVGMQISILQGSATGTEVYVERHISQTNINGLVGIEIGGGTVISGEIATIDWSSGTYFLKTEIDINGGANYSITGTSQFLSVPYAKFAEKSGDRFSGDYNDLTNKPNFTNYDTDVTDDFDGQYNSLIGVPSKISEFTNDAGYITEAGIGNKVFSFSFDTNISGSYKRIDTVEVKANRLVIVKGYTKSTGSKCTVLLKDINDNWVSSSTDIYISYTEDGVPGYAYRTSSGALGPYSDKNVVFEAYFKPLKDMSVVVMTKELSSTAANGVGEATVIVTQ